MNFKETFLKLTEYTVPFGYEKTLEPLLPIGYKKDNIGNYYYQIGNSTTLFTSHLDTASKERVKINHIIDGNIIKTDGTTILGGDNKAGCTILFYMIQSNIPGTYYFFLGEEMAVHDNYPYGSIKAIEEDIDKFKKFNRVVTFDRKEKGQLVTRQLGRICCSEQFADRLIEDYLELGVEYKKDRTGYYTDSAFFSDIVPECVNLSAGVYNEHHKNEYVDIEYIKKIAESSIHIDWESLPIDRKIENFYQIDKRDDMEEIKNISNDQVIFKDIFTTLDDLYYVCHEIRSYTNYISQFKSDRIYHFTRWHEDDNINLSIKDGIIISNRNNNGSKDSFSGSLDEFKGWIGIEKMDIKLFSNLLLGSLKNDKISDADFNYLINIKSILKDDVKSYLASIGYNLSEIGKGYLVERILKESYIKKFNKFRNGKV